MISDNIRTLRKEFGLTQSEFAEKIGQSRSVVANLEYGNIQNIDAKMPLFRLIAKTFGVTVEWILNGGPLELADTTPKEDAAEELGRAMASGSITVDAFVRFWAQRTPEERAALDKMIADFVRQLKEEG